VAARKNGLAAFVTSCDNARLMGRVYSVAALAGCAFALSVHGASAKVDTLDAFHGAASDLVPTAVEAGYANLIGHDSTGAPLNPAGFEAGWDGNYHDDLSVSQRGSEFGVFIYRTIHAARAAFAIPQMSRLRRPTSLGLGHDVRVKASSSLTYVTGTTTRLWCADLVSQRRNVLTLTMSCRETPPATRLDARNDGARIQRLVYRRMVALGG
jgi:hypothetical protein